MQFNILSVAKISIDFANAKDSGDGEVSIIVKWNSY